jgi:hypothetical protein
MRATSLLQHIAVVELSEQRGVARSARKGHRQDPRGVRQDEEAAQNSKQSRTRHTDVRTPER